MDDHQNFTNNTRSRELSLRKQNEEKSNKRSKTKYSYLDKVSIYQIQNSTFTFKIFKDER